MKPWPDDECRNAPEQPADCPLGACPLSRAKAGVAMRVKKLSAPADVNQRLREIGFVEDQVIRLVGSHSNVICMVCNARLALSAQLAEMILVEPIAA